MYSYLVYISIFHKTTDAVKSLSFSKDSAVKLALVENVVISEIETVRAWVAVRVGQQQHEKNVDDTHHHLLDDLVHLTLLLSAKS